MATPKPVVMRQKSRPAVIRQESMPVFDRQESTTSLGPLSHDEIDVFEGQVSDEFVYISWFGNYLSILDPMQK